MIATASETTFSVIPVMPVNEPPVRSALSASQERVSVVPAGFSVASSSEPPVTLNPMPFGTPTKTLWTVREISVSVAPVRSAVWSPVRSTSTVCVSNENPTVPVTKPKTSIVTEPLARKRSPV